MIVVFAPVTGYLLGLLWLILSPFYSELFYTEEEVFMLIMLLRFDMLEEPALAFVCPWVLVITELFVLFVFDTL